MRRGAPLPVRMGNSWFPDERSFGRTGRFGAAMAGIVVAGIVGLAVVKAFNILNCSYHRAGRPHDLVYTLRNSLPAALLLTGALGAVVIHRTTGWSAAARGFVYGTLAVLGFAVLVGRCLW